VTTYALDAAGQLPSVTDARGNTTTNTYDPAGRLTAVTSPATPPAITQYAYDAVGNQLSVTDPNGHVTQKQYDARRRLITTTYDDKTTTQHTYDGPGNLASAIDQAGKVVQYTADADNELQSVIQLNSPDPAPQNTTAYAYGKRVVPAALTFRVGLARLGKCPLSELSGHFV
jgi:YD repeat-containing protein